MVINQRKNLTEFMLLMAVLMLILAACSVSEPPAPNDDLTAQACQPVISMDRVMELLRDTKNSAGKTIPQSQWVTAGAIAKAESGLCVRAVNTSNSNGSTDRGLFQINSIHGYSPSCLYNASCNTKAAITIYHQRGNWRPWSVYKNRRYRRYLNEAQAAFNRLTNVYDVRVFDWQYYLSRYPDLRANGVRTQAQAQQHWRDYGIREGRRASPMFATKFYLGRYSDLRRAFGNDYAKALDHYLTTGSREARTGTEVNIYSSRVFNWRYYLNKYPDLRQNNVDTEAKARRHWRDYGILEGRRGSAEFHSNIYYRRYADLRRAFTGKYKNYALLRHYLLYGIKEGRDGN